MAMRQQDSELDGVISGRTAIAGLVAFAVLAVSTLVLFLVRSDAATEVRGNPGTTWISGETEGRLVMAATGDARPSVAVEIGKEGDAYDVVDLGNQVLAHNRVTGDVTVLDGGGGLVTGTIAGTPATDERSALVGAGEVGYLVDPASSTVVRIDENGVAGSETVIERGFTDWVGTSDGRLWMLNRNDGSYSTFNGTGVDRRSFADPGADLVLSAVGGDPVVLDRDASRLRWLRRNKTVEIAGGEDALLQEPDPAGTCAHVIADETLSCVGPDGPLRTMRVAVPDDLGSGAQLVANQYNAVVGWPGREQVVIADWRSKQTTQDEHPEPSARGLVGWSTVGPLLVNDPASRFAFTIDRGELVQLDKFSRQTVLLSPEGQSLNGDGASEIAEEAEVEAVFAEPTENLDVVTDDDGRNDPPQAFPDEAVTRSGRDVIIPVLANDIDPDGDPLAVTTTSPITSGAGELTVLGGAEVLFTPPEDFTGEAVFDYTVADPDGLTSSATVTVTVLDLEVNTAPSATDDAVKTQAGTSVDIDVLRNDTDAEGDPLTITAIDTPASGTVASIGAGEIRYVPNQGFIGTDTFGYSINDGFGGEATAIVRVEVVAAEGSSRPPEAVDDRASTAAGKPVSVEVLANDTDPDGDPLRVVDVEPLAGVDLSIVDSRTITALPAATTSGLLTFMYTVEDTHGLRDTARVALNVDPAQANRPPKAVDDKATSPSVSIPLDVVANDVDPDGDPLLIVNVSDPQSGGSVVQTGPRSIQFTPARAFTGTTSFRYTISDPFSQTSSATVTITVIPQLGSGPVARDDAVSVFAGDAVTIAPLANDNHPDGLAFGLAGPPVVRDGAATLGPNNTILYTPPAIGSGPFVLTYTIKDELGNTATASITVTVVARPPVNRPPVAKDDLGKTTYTTALMIDVLANDSDPEGSKIKLDSITQPAGGTGQASIAGSLVRYTPPANFDGLASFKYTVADDQGLKATATVLIQVAPRVLIPPVANPDYVSLLTDGTATIRPTENDIDPDGAAADLRITSIGNPSGLSVSQAGGVVTITAGRTPGSYSVPYSVIDRDGKAASSTITVVVDFPVNNPPIANPDSYGVFPNQPALLSPNVLINDGDPEGGALELVSVAQPAGGGGTVEQIGQQVRFTPTGSPGTVVTFSYTVRDTPPIPGMPRKESTGTVTVTINPCPQPSPALASDTRQTRYVTPIVIDAFANDTAHAGSLTFTQPATGTGTVTEQGPTGTFVYTPPAGFNGKASFTYKVTNVCGVPGEATVTIDVNQRPTAGPVTTSTGKNKSISIALPVSDPDGDALTPVVVAGSASGGSAVVEGTGIRFTPSPAFTGQATFQYYVVDIGGLQSSPATVTVNVANAPPAAGDFNVTMNVGNTLAVSVNVLQPPTNDPDGDSLTVTGATVVSGPGVAVPAGNTVVYTPGPVVASTTATIRYTIFDGTSPASGTITVTIEVPVPNRAPTAGTDSSSGLSKTVAVLGNDTDPDGDPLTVTGASVESVTRVVPDPPPSTPGSGDPGVTVSNSPSTVSYSVSDPTFTGSIVLAYTISDGRGGTATGKINITIS